MLLGVMIAVAISLYRGNMRGKELTFGEFSTGVQSGKFTKDNVFELTFGPHLITFQNQPDATKSADATAGKPAAEQITDPAAKAAEAAALQRFHIPREG